jgi:hypothetical protein
VTIPGTHRSPDTGPHGSGSNRHILRAVGRCAWWMLRGQPVRTVAVLGLFPYAWMYAGSLAVASLASLDGPWALRTLPRVVYIFWIALLAPFVVRATMGLARGKKVLTAVLAVSPRSVGRSGAVLLVVQAPELMTRLIQDAEGGQAYLPATITASLFMLALKVRMFLALPMTIEMQDHRPNGALRALRLSWHATRGKTIALLALSLLPLATTSLLGVVGAAVLGTPPLHEDGVWVARAMPPLEAMVETLTFMHLCHRRVAER